MRLNSRLQHASGGGRFQDTDGLARGHGLSAHARGRADGPVGRALVRAYLRAWRADGHARYRSHSCRRSHAAHAIAHAPAPAAHGPCRALHQDDREYYRDADQGGHARRRVCCVDLDAALRDYHRRVRMRAPRPLSKAARLPHPPLPPIRVILSSLIFSSRVDFGALNMHNLHLLVSARGCVFHKLAGALIETRLAVGTAEVVFLSVEDAVPGGRVGGSNLVTGDRADETVVARGPAAGPISHCLVVTVRVRMKMERTPVMRHEMRVPRLRYNRRACHCDQQQGSAQKSGSV